MASPIGEVADESSPVLAKDGDDSVRLTDLGTDGLITARCHFTGEIAATNKSLSLKGFWWDFPAAAAYL